MAMRVLGYKTRDIGLTFKFSPIQLAITATGVGFGFVEYLILRPQALVAELSVQEVLLPALILFFFVGFGEELIFRGVLRKTAVDAFGWWGIVYIGFIFAILHMGFFLGLMLSLFLVWRYFSAGQ